MQTGLENKFPPALERALEILNLYGSSMNSSYTIKEISDSLNLPYTSVFRIIKCLAEYGYLAESVHTKNKFKLGIKLISLGKSALANDDIAVIVAPYLSQLSSDTNQACRLTTLTRNGVITLDQTLPQDGITLISKLGEERPISMSASGRVLTSLLPKEDRAPYIDHSISVDHDAIEDAYPDINEYRDELNKQLDQISAQGCCIDISESVSDIACIAVPLFDFTNKAIAAISITGHVSGYAGEDSIQQKLSLLQKASREISEKLGYEALAPAGDPPSPRPV